MQLMPGAPIQKPSAPSWKAFAFISFRHAYRSCAYQLTLDWTSFIFALIQILAAPLSAEPVSAFSKTQLQKDYENYCW
jgi:hypothetical protein